MAQEPESLVQVVTARPQLLYILAPSYSGSTLLTYLLAQHPEIATIGELKATRMGDIENYVCSCGAYIRKCPFWNDVSSRAREAGLEFAIESFGTVYSAKSSFVRKLVAAGVRGPLLENVRSALLRLLPESSTGIEHVTRQNQELSKIICEMQGGSIFLDGSKDANRLLHFIRSGRWRIRVIYLQRDGRGVARSYRKHDGQDWTGAIAYWRRAVQELQTMRRRLPDSQVFDLHYEKLANDPEGTMASIWRWLGIEQHDMQQLDAQADDNHILGNKMRLRNLSEIRLDEKWRKNLREDEINSFLEQAGAMNRQLGYLE